MTLLSLSQYVTSYYSMFKYVPFYMVLMTATAVSEFYPIGRCSRIYIHSNWSEGHESFINSFFFSSFQIRKIWVFVSLELSEQSVYVVERAGRRAWPLIMAFDGRSGGNCFHRSFVNTGVLASFISHCLNHGYSQHYHLSSCYFIHYVFSKIQL